MDTAGGAAFDPSPPLSDNENEEDGEEAMDDAPSPPLPEPSPSELEREARDLDSHMVKMSELGQSIFCTEFEAGSEGGPDPNPRSIASPQRAVGGKQPAVSSPPRSPGTTKSDAVLGRAAQCKRRVRARPPSSAPLSLAWSGLSHVPGHTGQQRHFQQQHLQTQ